MAGYCSSPPAPAPYIAATASVSTFLTVHPLPQARPGGLPLTISVKPEIREVILSGGDPLLLSTEKLGHLSRQLESLNHVRTLRIHSRVPTVLPERINENLLDWLESVQLRKVLVIHSNHQAELDHQTAQVCGEIGRRGTRILNQSVLLRNVNDTVRTQERLVEKLMDCGILPYYLHILDRAQGTAHHEVPEAKAVKLMKELRLRLPGYLVPRLVREMSGFGYKMPIL